MKRGIGYVRVSTEEQANSGLSLSAQTEKIKAYALLNDIDLVDVIMDAGLSGKNTDREGLQQILEMVKVGTIDAFIVCKLDRLSRKVVDTLEMIEDFEKAGVAFHSIQEKVDTKSAIGKFFLTITAAFAEMERNVISERTSAALQEKRRQGKLAGKVPFGFDLGADGETLSENPNEQEAMRVMSELRGRGLTLRAIADELTHRGFSPKTGKKWHPQSIKNLCGVRS